MLDLNLIEMWLPDLTEMRFSYQAVHTLQKAQTLFPEFANTKDNKIY